ncbi:hypothetical protein [Nocardia sp. NPDC051832]|uniref:hypothetical protein n=1 Tax=Nocardia sp. NPDC051832 TaxID=3155673 RepID=UPI003445FB14
MPADMFWFAFTVWLVAFSGAGVAWGRRVVYRADRWVADTLGLETMNHALVVARRVRYQRRGLFGMYMNLFIPAEAKRTDAISCFALGSTELRSPTRCAGFPAALAPDVTVVARRLPQARMPLIRNGDRKVAPGSSFRLEAPHRRIQRGASAMSGDQLE